MAVGNGLVILSEAKNLLRRAAKDLAKKSNLGVDEALSLLYNTLCCSESAAFAGVVESADAQASGACHIRLW